MISLKAQRIGEIRARRAQFERRNAIVSHSLSPAHLPRIDPGVKRFGFGTGLAYSAAGKRFAKVMGVGAGDGRVSHPYLLIGPTLLLWAGIHSLTKQRPLRAVGRSVRIGKIGRHVPPLDAKVW